MPETVAGFDVVTEITFPDQRTPRQAPIRRAKPAKAWP